MAPGASASSSTTTKQKASSSGTRKHRGNGPKSSRLQYTACGACRMRRVKCDLKEALMKHQQDPTAPNICSNCNERDLRCVDEYAEVKQVKALRKGRRIKAVEDLYGIKTEEESTDDPLLSLHTALKLPQPSFFDQPFMRRFAKQHPFLDPADLTTRYLSIPPPLDRSSQIDCPFRLLAAVLTTWATAMGVDDAGQEWPHSALAASTHRAAVETACHEIAHRLDTLAVLSTPSWDGLHALLLFLPLAEGVLPAPTVQVMRATASAQVLALCFANTEQPDVPAARPLVKAQTFWYAYSHDAIDSTLRGSRPHFRDADLRMFQNTLQSMEEPSNILLCASQSADAPLRIAAACRIIYEISEAEDEYGVDRIERDVADAWHTIEDAWRSLESLKAGANDGDQDEVSIFVHTWQLVIFECRESRSRSISCIINGGFTEHRIREALRSRVASGPFYDPVASASVSGLNSERLRRLATVADLKCGVGAKAAVSLLRASSSTTLSGASQSLLAFDAAYVRDAVFHTGLLLADEATGDVDAAEGAVMCLSVLGELRWACARTVACVHALQECCPIRPLIRSRYMRQPQGVLSPPASVHSPPAAMHSPQSITSFTPDSPVITRARAIPPPLHLQTLDTRQYSDYDGSAPLTANSLDGTWPPSLSSGASTHSSSIGSPTISPHHGLAHSMYVAEPSGSNNVRLSLHHQSFLDGIHEKFASSLNAPRCVGQQDFDVQLFDSSSNDSNSGWNNLFAASYPPTDFLQSSIYP